MKQQLLYFIIAVLLSSCYTQKKATQQTNKALQKYPGVVATIARDNFPCIETSIDTSDVERAKDEWNKIYLTLDSALNTEQFKNESLRALINKLKMDSTSVKNCGELMQEAINYSNHVEGENENLVKIINRLKSVGPGKVIQRIEDSSKVFLANQETAKAISETAKWKAKYDAEHDLRVELQKRIKGKILLPWWVIPIIVLLLVFYFRNSIKSLFMKSIIPVLLVTLLTSCGHFHDAPTVSVWAEGMWLVFWIPFLASFLFLYNAFRQQKKGDWKVVAGATTKETATKKPIYYRWRFWAFWILQLFAWGVVVYLNSNYWR